MSVGPLSGINVSAAGAPLAQTKGSESNGPAKTLMRQSRNVTNERKAEAAAGIGETDGEDHQTGERDADGRRLGNSRPGAKKSRRRSRQSTKNPRSQRR